MHLDIQTDSARSETEPNGLIFIFPISGGQTKNSDIFMCNVICMQYFNTQEREEKIMLNKYVREHIICNAE